MNAKENIRLLNPDDAGTLIVLRREALEREPLSFLASAADDRGLSMEFVCSMLGDPEQAVFGYFDGGELSGMVGVLREPKVKQRHKARVWGLYVAARARQRGVARALLEAVIAHARTWSGVDQLHLSVSAAAPAAARLYDTLGFSEWGREPRALAYAGTCVDESHRVLELGHAPAAPPITKE